MDDTAQNQENNPKQVNEKFRNILFDLIVESGLECYVALLVDIDIDLTNKKHLFCGQVGKIEKIVPEQETEGYYLVTFLDYKKDQETYYGGYVKKENLLPLFSFDPDKNKNYTEPLKNQNIDEIREKWASRKFEVKKKNELKPHKKSANPFRVGQLVTIEFDVKQDLPNNENFIIQAGQTGIISKKFKKTDFVTDNTDLVTDNTDFVEVTFWSMPFELLALEKKKLFRSPYRFRYSSWEKKIRINKNYLLPLYVENLR